MFKIFAKLPRFAVLISVVGLTALAAWAATAVNVTATLATTCTNCDTDIAPIGGSGNYGLISDGFAYPGGDPLVVSNIITHNAVYTLDTSATLVNGYVDDTSRTVKMHFYSPVECKPGQVGCTWPNNKLPPCWGADAYDQEQAVNWSVFAPKSFLRMTTGAKYSGMARLNFNVRNAACDGQVNRFRLEWPVVCITRTGTGSWAVTSQACTSTSLNIGEAHLQAYGGTKKNTVDYGDWRMPFFLTLTR